MNQTECLYMKLRNCFELLSFKLTLNLCDDTLGGEDEVAAVRRADRVWLGTDALGTDAFLGRVGTGALVECARELGVTTTVLATTDKLTPGGDLTLPDWAAGEAWHLWESAPRDVEVEAQPFESVGLEWVDGVATEVGLHLLLPPRPPALACPRPRQTLGRSEEPKQ